jgi:uncharacterized protein YijF (DUF1287 family)
MLALVMMVLPLAAQESGTKIVEAARKQVGVTLSYDPAYVTLKYPGGDLPREKGVCTDVVIRALRDGLGQDLQKLVHEDMKADFAAYPKNWGLSRPDKNIDGAARQECRQPLPARRSGHLHRAAPFAAYHDRQRKEIRGGRSAGNPQHRQRGAGGRRAVHLSADRALPVEVKMGSGTTASFR